jgi:hypothetical protein
MMKYETKKKSIIFIIIISCKKKIRTKSRKISVKRMKLNIKAKIN